MPRLLMALALALCLPTARADTLLIDRIHQDPPNAPGGVPRPEHGDSMDRVLARFGEPRERIPAVGDPPIGRWVYPDFTVYFEHRLTLRAVLNRDGR
jgi:hypothetical protein